MPMPDPSLSTEDATFRVLVIVSRPLDLNELPITADQWALLNGLSTVNTPAHLAFLRPPTVERLRTEILGGYNVVHFDGHGTSSAVNCPNCAYLNPPGSRKCGRCSASLEGEEPRAYLHFEQDDGTQDALAAEDLARMINAVPGKPTKLAILSACGSAKGGDKSLSAILKQSGVPAVLGMKEIVSVDLTIALSHAFYAFLGAGLEIGEAFDQALPSLAKLPKSGVGTPAQDIPVLEGKGTSVRIVERPMRGEVIVGKERIFGVPEYEFVGEFIRYDPPKGRKGLIALTVRALLDGEKLVVLTGQGGIGKSVLGAEAARRVAWRYPGGVFWRSAADIENMGLNELLDGFVNVFGYEFRTLPIDGKRDGVLDYLRNMSTASLIVVDNAETIKDPALWRFLEGIPKPSAALVTSREALERDGTHIDIYQMEPFEATRLFIVEARRRKPGWGAYLAQSDIKALEEISGHLEGHPLAIKLAAAMVGSDSLETIRKRVLAAPHKEVSQRFDFSYDTLSDSEKELLHRLAAFASSATEPVIELACNHPDFVGDDALPQWRDDLSELVRKSFVDTVDLPALAESGDEITLLRYRLHPLMRQYASGKAGEDAMKINRRRAANLFLAYAAQFEDNYNALQAEHDNLLAGMDWAYAAEEWEMVRNFVLAINYYLDIRGYWNEERIRLEQAARAGRELGDRIFEAQLIGEIANTCQKQGLLQKAQLGHKRAQQLFEELGDKSGVSKSLHQLGMLAQATGHIDEARRLYGESLKIAKNLGDKRLVAKSLHQQGILARDAGDIDEARRLHSDSLKIAQKFGDKRLVAKSLHQLGMLAQATGDIDEARRLHSDSLKIAKKLGDKSDVARSLHQLGTLAQSTGDIEEARHLYEESLKMFLEMGDKSGVSNSLAQSALLEEMEGNLEKALDLIHKAETMFLELKSPMVAQARQIRERLEQTIQDK